MSRLWIMVAVMMSIGLSAGAQNRLPDRTVTPAEQAKRQKEEGDRRLKTGDAAGAEAAYRKAAQLDTSSYNALEALGNLLFSNNRFLEAAETFQKAVQAEPRYIIGYYNIAHAYRKAGKNSEAIKYYKKYLEKKPDDADTYYGLAATYEASGQNQAALDNYLLYIEKESRPSERQYVVIAKEKADQLRKAPGKSTPVEPEGADTTPTVQATKHKEPSSAKPDSTLPPPRSPTGNEKAVTLMKDGDAAMKEQSYIKAMKAYYDAVQADSRNPDALYRLGLAYQVNSNPKAAALRWRQALTIDPNHYPSLKALAEIEGRPAPLPPPSPPPDAQAKPEEKPSPVPAPVDKKDPPVANIPPDTAPPSPDSREVRELIAKGDTAFQKNNFNLAITHFLHASKLNPKNEEALFKLGLSYAMTKNHQIAIFKWQQVLAINPANELAKRNLAIAERNLNGGSEPYQSSLSQ